jgi:hypothetical protein
LVRNITFKTQQVGKAENVTFEVFKVEWVMKFNLIEQKMVEIGYHVSLSTRTFISVIVFKTKFLK